ncbi:hypothetical protein NFI96_019076, partial [Prochilodus magdalenae]
MHCTDNDFLNSVSFCNSSKECGFDGFPDNLLGYLQCDITKENEVYQIDCTGNVKCEQKMHLCATPKECKWAPNPLFKDISNSMCFLKHD